MKNAHSPCKTGECKQNIGRNITYHVVQIMWWILDADNTILLNSQINVVCLSDGNCMTQKLASCHNCVQCVSLSHRYENIALWIYQLALFLHFANVSFLAFQKRLIGVKSLVRNNTSVLLMNTKCILTVGKPSCRPLSKTRDDQ